MNLKKLEFSRSVTHMIEDVCKLIFNLKSIEETDKMLCLSHEKKEAVIDQMTQELPDELFEQPPAVLEEIKRLCAQEFIFFQVQEIGNPAYEENLKKFIKFFSRDIKQRIQA